jgi:energy-coupling factor transport system ATP-binding protein
MIKVENVSFRYNKEEVLKDINLEIKNGECICIVGNNGSGKSTLAKLIAGVIIPSKGKIFIDEINTSDKKSYEDLRKKIGIVFQNPENQIIFSNVYDDIAFGIHNLKLDDEKNRIETSLGKVGMKDYIKESTYELSMGQKQRVTIAGALAMSTQILVLDEATAMLDTRGKGDIYRVINNLKEAGYTVIYTTNISDEIFMADRVIILNNKTISAEIEKEKLIEKIDTLKALDIRLPKLLQIIEELSKRGIDINLNEFTIQELADQISGEIKK